MGEVLIPLALEQLAPGHLGAPGVSHPHTPPTVSAAGRPVRPLKHFSSQIKIFSNYIKSKGVKPVVYEILMWDQCSDFSDVEVKSLASRPTCISQGSVLQGKNCVIQGHSPVVSYDQIQLANFAPLFFHHINFFYFLFYIFVFQFTVNG